MCCVMQSIVLECAQFNLPGRPNFQRLCFGSTIGLAPEVLELKDAVDEWSGAEVECGGLGVHEAAHDHEAEEDLADDEHVVYAVQGQLVRVLHRLDKRHDRERDYKEDREDYERY